MAVGLMAPAASGVTGVRMGPLTPFQCRSTGVFFGTRAKAEPVTVTWLPAGPELVLRLRAARFVQAKAAEAMTTTPMAAMPPAANPNRLMAVLILAPSGTCARG